MAKTKKRTTNKRELKKDDGIPPDSVQPSSGRDVRPPSLQQVSVAPTTAQLPVAGTEHPHLTPVLTEPYRSAHKLYGLFSALLIAWELVGFNVEEAPLQNLKITLKSPDAIPYILIVLVIYFAYRLFIEWLQCPAECTRVTATRFDFVLSHLIGLGSIGLYGFQRLTQIQVANLPPNLKFDLFNGFILGALLYLWLVKIYYTVHKWKKIKATAPEIRFKSFLWTHFKETEGVLYYVMIFLSLLSVANGVFKGSPIFIWGGFAVGVCWFGLFYFVGKYSSSISGILKRITSRK